MTATYQRCANADDVARYALLVASSAAYRDARHHAMRFYRNGHAFVDAAHAAAHAAACDTWTAELRAAGFVITDRGLQVVVVPTTERRQA